MQWAGGKSSAFQEKEISQAGWKTKALRLDFVPVPIHLKFRKRHYFHHATSEFLKWNLFCVMPVQWEKWQFLAAVALQNPRLWADRAKSRDCRCCIPLFFQAPSRQFKTSNPLPVGFQDLSLPRVNDGPGIGCFPQSHAHQEAWVSLHHG